MVVHYIYDDYELFKRIIRFMKDIGKYNEKNCFNLLKAFANSIQTDAILLRIVPIFY